MLEEIQESEHSKTHEENPESVTSAAELRFAAHQALGGNIPEWHERAHLPGLTNLSHKDQLPWFGMQIMAEKMKELESRLRKLESGVPSKGKK